MIFPGSRNTGQSSEADLQSMELGADGVQVRLFPKLVPWRIPRKKMSWPSLGIIHLKRGDIPLLICSDMTNEKFKCLGSHGFRN